MGSVTAQILSELSQREDGLAHTGLGAYFRAIVDEVRNFAAGGLRL